jgi:polar amino acid transport system substrate-binding protein
VADLGGKKVCAAEGSTSIKNIAANPAKTNPAPIAVSVRDWTDCVVMLQQGQVDAMSTDDTILSGMQLQDPNDTQLVGDRFTQEPYGIAISKDHPELVGFVNGVLDRMRRDGTLHRIYVSWLQDNAPASVPGPVYQG